MSKHNIPLLNLKKKVTLNYTKSAAMGFFFQRTQERVRNSRSKRAFSVRATEVLVYIGLEQISLGNMDFAKTVIKRYVQRF